MIIDQTGRQIGRQIGRHEVRNYTLHDMKFITITKFVIF